MRRTATALAALTVASTVAWGSACLSEVDVGGLESIDDYEDWFRVEARGEVGGHGDSIRFIYANDIAREYSGFGLYAFGTVIVKEIRFIESDDTAGDINYIAIMRKLSEAPPGGDLDDDWLFTTQSDVGAAEVNNPRCWRTCHQASPLDGTFLNWSSSP